MDQLSNALRNIIGKVPRYMRSPYFAANDLSLRTLGELGFHVIHASIDTLDWANDSQGAIGTSVQRFKDGLNAGGTIELSHDVHQWTANVLVQEMINDVKGKGLRGMFMSSIPAMAQGLHFFVLSDFCFLPPSVAYSLTHLCSCAGRGVPRRSRKRVVPISGARER